LRHKTERKKKLAFYDGRISGEGVVEGNPKYINQLSKFQKT
jgi:hypothetical protein